MPAATLSASRLLEVISYDPETGAISRISSRIKAVKLGPIPGNPCTDGYIRLGVDGRGYLAHRLAWLYVYGEWPQGQVDHINGVRTDNRIANLRDSTHAENCQNIQRARAASKSGLLGAFYCTRDARWYSLIRVNGKRHYLGGFAGPMEAHHAYIKAKKRMHRFSNIALHGAQS